MAWQPAGPAVGLDGGEVPPADDGFPADDEPEEEELPPTSEEVVLAPSATADPELTLPAETPGVASPDEVAFAGDTIISGGEASTSGLLSVSDLGLGTVDASAPTELTVGETGSVRLEIRPAFDPDEMQVEVLVTVTAIDEPVEVLNFFGELRVYSIMEANISAPAFDVETATPQVQRLSGDAPALWLWNVVPRRAGLHSISVSVSVPVVIDGEVQQISTSPLRTIEFGIDVQPLPPTATPLPPPTPVPTATPGFVARTLDSISIEIVGALVLTVLGALVTFIWGRLGLRKSDKDEKPK